MPAFIFSGKTTDERAHGGAAYCCDAPDSDAVDLLGWLVHVCDGCSSGRENWASNEAGDEAKGEEHSEVLGVYHAKLEQDEGE